MFIVTCTYDVILLLLAIYAGCLYQQDGHNVIDHFRDIPLESQTTDITHFAVVFHYDVTIKALETLRSKITYDVIMKNNGKLRDVRSLTVMSRELENGLLISFSCNFHLIEGMCPKICGN